MSKFATQEIKPECAMDCVLYEKCSAPVCPVDEDGVWYSDEEICTNRYFQQDKMVKNQKRLRKVKASGIFTPVSLKKIQRVRKNTKGMKAK